MKSMIFHTIRLETIIVNKKPDCEAGAGGHRTKSIQRQSVTGVE